MKNLILCSFLLLFVGFTYSQETIKLKEIGLEVMKEDLGRMNWYEAKKACANLGYGWRLPTTDELYKIHKYKNKIGGFKNDSYWSSSDFDSLADVFHFGRENFNVNDTLKSDNWYVRAVRDLK